MPKVTDTIGTLPSHDIGPTVAPNPYGPGDFAYQDGYLTCVSGESLLGVDVSEHQGQIDWQKVAESGVKFAMIRIGYRAWGSQGELHADAYGAENLKGAMEAGLQVGVYFFSQAISVEEAREEAQYVLVNPTYAVFSTEFERTEDLHERITLTSYGQPVMQIYERIPKGE